MPQTASAILTAIMLFATSPALAQTAPAADGGVTQYWWVILLLLIAVGAAWYYMKGRNRV